MNFTRKIHKKICQESSLPIILLILKSNFHNIQMNFQLALFLHACGSVEDATKTIKIYYTARADATEHFSKRDPGSDEIQQCLNNQ